MFTFSGPQDLLDTVRKMGEDAEKASRDERHLKRDQLAARVRAAAAYPDVARAIAFVEIVLCGPLGPDDPDTAWDVMMRALPPVDPATVVALIRETLDDEFRDEFPRARVEAARPAFLTYIAGKMGAV